MDYPVLNAFWTICMVFLWVLWLYLLFKVVGDILRSEDLGGWTKAAWMAFVLLLPYVGILVYVIARGRGMSARETERAEKQQQAFRAYVREAAAPAPGERGTAAEQLAKLAELKEHGDLSEEEFQKAKVKILA